MNEVRTRNRDYALRAFSKGLSRMLSNKGITATQLARIIGLSPTIVLRYTNGDSLPSVHSLLMISCALEVKMDDLFDKEENINAK